MNHIFSLASLWLSGAPAAAMATALVSFMPPHDRICRFSQPNRPIPLHSPSPNHLRPSCARQHLRILAIQETKEAETNHSAEEITEKYGLEFGLWKIFSSKERGGKREGEGKVKSTVGQAKELLAKYGGAYLATSITVSLISFALCYVLVSAGIDIQALLSKANFNNPQIQTSAVVYIYKPEALPIFLWLHFQVGIITDKTGGKVGTFALAYAAHKAASPIRFPPTVALTPIIASWIRKKAAKTDK